MPSCSTARSASVWLANRRILALMYSSMFSWKSRWFSLMFSRMPTRGCSVEQVCNWKLDNSSTTTSAFSPDRIYSDSGVPILPPVNTASPCSFNMAAHKLVVVVLPLVPVTPSTGSPESWRHASSVSAMISGGLSSGRNLLMTAAATPGLGTTSFASRNWLGECSPHTISTPADSAHSAKSAGMRSKERSSSRTRAPSLCSSLAADTPETPAPTTTARSPGFTAGAGFVDISFAAFIMTPE